MLVFKTFLLFLIVSNAFAKDEYPLAYIRQELWHSGIQVVAKKAVPKKSRKSVSSIEEIERPLSKLFQE